MLEVYINLAIKTRIDAATSRYSITNSPNGYSFGDQRFALRDFVTSSHASELGDFPKYVRCRKVDPSVGCDRTGRKYWKHSEKEKTDSLKFSVECITDNFSGQEVLAESAFTVWKIIGYSMETNWNADNRMNCLIDYVKVIEFLYGTMFWRVGSLMI